ncbi:subtilisin-like proprotein convertase family protein [Nocardioides cavernae]|uniref:Subtilisin-like proprotein convertase family protein n=1 Tax=Nocardioides cavernae TaxID=1921566 RepID=A0A7Y9KRY8_9ACTN|nr:Ig-like domain-containing protein [Nocardioides cavernae]NYE37049.1 subtilisin-like proprotein convertase family protein [Nocardioides cavernae]
MRFLPSSVRRGLLAATLLSPVLATLGLSAPADAATTTVTNASAISIPSSGTANPYPSTVSVSGMASRIRSVELTLTGFQHQISYDAHVMLVSPTGRNLTVMSDIYSLGGARTFTFADGAPRLANGSPSGRYAPTDNDEPNNFPAPAPARTGVTTFADAFKDTNPNGTWQLFVYDDIGGGSGSIASWSLTVDAGIPHAVTFGSTAPAPARVGDTYTPTATSDAGLAVTYAVDTATTNDACRLADDDRTLFFQHSGSCVVAASAPGDADHDPARATQTIAVRAARSDLATLAISPEGASTTAGEPVSYTVVGADSNGLAIPGQQAGYSYAPADGGSSTVCVDAACAPEEAGTYTVTATAPGADGPITDSTTLTVLADGVAALQVSPEGATTTAGTPVQITVGGTDRFGNALPDQTSASTVVATPVGGGDPVACPSGLCDLTAAGVYSVGASQSGADAPAGDATTLTVTPAALDHVELGGEATTAAGSPVVFTVTAYDEFDNIRTGGTPTVTATHGATSVACPNGVCSPTKAGTWTVEGAIGSASDTTSLEVTPGALASLVVTPDVTTVTPGTDVAYSATGADTYGNDLGDRTAQSTFTIARGTDEAKACADAVCTPAATGNHRVTATIGGVTGAATLVSALPSVAVELGALPAATYGDVVPLSATVTSADGTPTGTVQFTLDGEPVGSPVPVDRSGTATAADLSGVRAGAHRVGATFASVPAGAFDAAGVTQQLVVAKAPTTTTLAVGSSLTATVASSVEEPTGTVTFAVDGVDRATVPLTAGSATWAGNHSGGADSVVTATYSGSADLLGSAASTARKDPKIVATVGGTARNGWHNTPVTVTFSCTPGSGVVTCPAPVTLSGDGAGQTVTRTVVASDGGVAAVTSAPVSIDRTAPVVRVTGVQEGRTYNGTVPEAACAGSDGLSGVASCTVTTTGRTGAASATVTATDLAGNTATATTSYVVRDLWVTRSEQVKGAWQLPVGSRRNLQLIGNDLPRLKGGKGLEIAPFRFAGRADGVGHWTARVRVPRGVRPGKVFVLRVTRGDGTTERVKLVASRR